MPNVVGTLLRESDAADAFAGAAQGSHYVPPGLPAGNYLSQAIVAIAQSTIPGAANRLEFYPYSPTRTISVDELALEVTALAAGAQARLGIYSATASGQPGSLLTGAGTLLDCGSTGIKTSAISPPLTLQAGVQYFLAIHSSGAPTYRAVPLAGLLPLPTTSGTPNTNYRATATFGSGLPATAASFALNSAVAPWLRLRTA